MRWTLRVYSRSGSTAKNRDAVEWAREAESRRWRDSADLDRPRRHQGGLPGDDGGRLGGRGHSVIASGGAGDLDDFVTCSPQGAPTPRSPWIFHYAETARAEAASAEHGIPVRL
jgi:imidazole glycerol phosphate synthase subunit HisF